MIRATELGGRAVVDMDAAEKLGNVHKVILDPDSRRVAGFVIARGSSLLSSGSETTLLASAVHAIGPDAITVRPAAVATADSTRLDGLPRVSDMVGRKVVSQDGRLLGTVDDVLIDAEDGRIVGYALAGGNALGKLLSTDKKDERPAYIRADADLRAGHDLIVAPADAVCRDWNPDAPVATPATATIEPSPSRWTTSAASSTDTRAWFRADTPSPSVEPRPGEDDGLLHR